MKRIGFWFGYRAQDPAEGTKPGDAPVTASKENLFSAFTCETHVAEFLGITDKAGGSVERSIGAYTKTVSKLGATEATKEFTARTVSRPCPTKALGRKISVQTGAKTAKGTPRQLSLTFPTGVTVGQIAEALGEYIPVGKIQRTGIPSATEIYPTFKVKGGGQYTIMVKDAAETSTNVDAPETVAEQQTVANKPK